ncbi:hypothetical protein KIF59_12405 [Enterobacter cloacae subsp. cloacae]|nr:hypothetical protein [Enterobacter cloacae subsp. cloacae]
MAAVVNAARGADLRYNMELTLEEAVRGVTKEIRIPTLEECDVCHGRCESGYAATNLSNPSRFRSGARCVRARASRRQQACPHCHGRGTLIKRSMHQMPRPRSRWRKPKPCPLNPGYVDTGDRIRLAGEGETGEHGAPAGDLYVFRCRVKQHAIF